MKLISCHDGKLHALDSAAGNVAGEASSSSSSSVFRSGLAALDALLPGQAFARGAVHELLSAPPRDGGSPAMFVAAMLAREASSSSSAAAASAAVVWSDPRRELYPPAVEAMGIPLSRLFLLHPADEADELWAVAECLRCPGVGAVVAALPERRRRLNRVEARRLQLAAERGGGVGLLLRTNKPGGGGAAEHAAVTRWLVRPERGERNVQRWRIQLIYGHGGRVGESVILEHHRDPRPLLPGGVRQPPRVEAHPLRPAAELADRPAAAKPAPARPGRASAG